MPKSAVNILLAIGFAWLSYTSMAQTNLADDLVLVRQNRIDSVQKTHSARPFIYSKEKPAFVRYNPVNLAFGGLLYVYQNVLSQQFSATCLYHPSCSEFSKQSIEEYGLLKGLFLSADRLTRCNRIAATGIHPIRIENNKVTDPVEFYRLK